MELFVSLLEEGKLSTFFTTFQVGVFYIFFDLLLYSKIEKDGGEKSLGLKPLDVDVCDPFLFCCSFIIYEAKGRMDDVRLPPFSETNSFSSVQSS